MVVVRKTVDHALRGIDGETKRLALHRTPHSRPSPDSPSSLGKRRFISLTPSEQPQRNRRSGSASGKITPSNGRASTWFQTWKVRLTRNWTAPWAIRGYRYW